MRNKKNSALLKKFIGLNYEIFTWNVKELWPEAGCAGQGGPAGFKVEICAGHGQVAQLLQVGEGGAPAYPPSTAPAASVHQVSHPLLNGETVGGGDEGRPRRGLRLQLLLLLLTRRG
jgi:hypothetical protein